MISLGEIRSSIEKGPDEARFTAWLTLYTSDDEAAKREMIRVIEGEDPVLRVLLARFLAHMNTEKAVQYLVRLLEDPNEVVFQTAKKAFERNFYEQKLKTIFPLIYSHRERVRDYAIEILSLVGDSLLVAPLLKFEKNATLEFKIKILAALRFLPDMRAVPVLMRYMDNANEELRYRALLALCANFEVHLFHTRSLWDRLLSDPSARIRQTVIWVLRKRPARRTITRLLEISKNDPDPMVRQEALMFLALFPEKRVFEHLVTLMVQSSFKALTLKAESILMGLPTKQMIHSLKELSKNSRTEVRQKVLLLMAELDPGSPELLEYFTRRLKHTRNDMDRLTLIQALGVLKNSGAITTLESYLNLSTLTDYAVMGSLLKLRPPEEGLQFKKYLDDNGQSPLVKQMILKTFLKYPKNHSIHEKLKGTLTRLMEDENLNVRYLATQVLALSASRESLATMFRALTRESDPVSADLFKKSVVQILVNQPVAALELIADYLEDVPTVSLIFSLLENVKRDDASVLELIRSLINPPFSLLRSRHRTTCLRLTLFYLKHHRLSLGLLLEALQSPNDKKELLIQLAGYLTTEPGTRIHLSFDMLKPWIIEPDPEKQKAVIILLGCSDDRRTISLLTTLLANPGQKPVHPVAKQVLHEMIRTLP